MHAGLKPLEPGAAMTESMHPFVANDLGGSTRATLIFARDARTAKPIGFCLAMAQPDVEIGDIQVRRLRSDREWLMSHARPRLVAAGLAHGTDNIPTCSCCETWRPLTDGRCADCAPRHEETSHA